MIAALLDTDILSLFREGHVEVEKRVLGSPFGSVGITVISVEEQLNGWYSLLRRSRRPDEVVEAYRQLARSVRSLNHFLIADFDLAAHARFQVLRAMKLNVGSMDLRIAAIALEQGSTVVTRNLRDFGRVPGLAVEDWSA